MAENDGTAQACEPVVYLNGAYLAKSAAHWPIEDRGTMFADGVYEVVRYYGGRGFAVDRHIERLKRSLAGIRLAMPREVDSLHTISNRVVAESGLSDAKVYWQVTRGTAERAHPFPTQTPANVLVLAYGAEPIELNAAPAALRASFQPDRRWADCWIKSLMLLPNVLAKQAAIEAGAEEAILHAGSKVTEGSATTVFIVCDGTLYTHPLDGAILGSITRELVIEQARSLGIAVKQVAFDCAALRAADEVFVCGTTTHVAAVTQVDDVCIGDGEVGPITRRLHAALLQQIGETCGYAEAR